jgi:hypothetical protein
MPVVENPSVTTLDELLDLVRRVEAAYPARDAATIARMLLRSKYTQPTWDWLLPSSAGIDPVRARGDVTAEDERTLAGDFSVTMPGGQRVDPSHAVAGVAARFEPQPVGGARAADFRRYLLTDLPDELTQLDVATWLGDIGSAAAEWATARPSPDTGSTRESYLAYWSPLPDLLGDVDGVALACDDDALGFAFDPASPLSANLRRYYLPDGERTGKRRAFHLFCALYHLPLEAGGVTLSAPGIARIERSVKLLADWYAANNVELRRWVFTHAPRAGEPISAESAGVLHAWQRNARDWRWFAGEFAALVQRMLQAEGA